MEEAKLKLMIKIKEDGEITVHDKDGGDVIEATLKEVLDSMNGLTVKSTPVLYYHSNPGWVFVNGRWYYIK